MKEADKAAEKKLDVAEKALKNLDDKLCMTQSLILTVTENGFGKRTDVDEYRLTARGAQGVNNLKATAKVGKTASILLVNETSELMVISQFGKIIRCDTKTIRAAGRATQGVRILNPGARRQGSRSRNHPARRTERRRTNAPSVEMHNRPDAGCPRSRF